MLKSAITAGVLASIALNILLITQVNVIESLLIAIAMGGIWFGMDQLRKYRRAKNTARTHSGTSSA